MKSKKTIYAIILFNVLILFGCGPRTDEQQVEKAKLVKVEQIKDFQDNEKLVFNGIIKEKSLTTLSFRVGGPLETLRVKTGDYVNAGDIIAILDKRDYQLQVQSTKAQYLQSMGEFERYKKLYEMNKTPANTFEKFQSGYLMAKSAYENALNQLEDTELIAPVSGYIHEKFIENFQTVGANDPIVSIIDLSHLEVLVSVPETKLFEIKNSQKNLLDVKNANISKIPVSVLSIGEKTMKDGLYEMKFVLENKKSLNVLPGMTAEVTMICPRGDVKTSVPLGAVFNTNNSAYVWVYDTISKTLHKRKVGIKNITSDGRMEVTSGLKTGEFIVTAGVHYLFENQKAQPISNTSETNIGGLL